MNPYHSTILSTNTIYYDTWIIQDNSNNGDEATPCSIW